MPIHEYVCKSCGKAFEHLHRRLNEPAPACPACGRRKAEKQFSTFAARAGAGKESALPPCGQGGACSRRCPAAGACGRDG